MSAPRFVADGLWQCLCPSFSSSLSQTTARRASSSALSNGTKSRTTGYRQCATSAAKLGVSRAEASERAGARPGGLQGLPRLPRRELQQRRLPATYQRRPSSTARREAMVHHDPNTTFYHPLAAASAASVDSSSPSFSNNPIFDSFTDLDPQSSARPRPRSAASAEDRKIKYETTTGIRKSGSKRELKLHDESTPILYDMARYAASTGDATRARAIVEFLVSERREEPNARLYAVLILANLNPRLGAAWRVAALLQEMGTENINMDVGICHDVLKVLAVHLDYLLRQDVLRYMEKRGFDLTDDGQHDVAAALLREGHLEMALQHMEDMTPANIHIRPWLRDLATYVMSESGNYEDALDQIKTQLAEGDGNISKAVWWNLLDNASSAFNYSVTRYCWISQVEPGYINPSAGLCLNVLTTAARAGDPDMATDVFHLLGKRSSLFLPIHYEQLLTAYINADPPDLRAALSVLTIMASVKLEPNAISTRPLFLYLRDRLDARLEAFDMLVQIKASGRPVPLAALNVIIEAHVTAPGGVVLQHAMTIYKAMHEFAPDQGPGAPFRPFADVETFNLLLRGTCRDPSPDSFKMSQFLVSEMLALKIKPNALTYDRLILNCLRANLADHAFGYFAEAERLGFRPRRTTLHDLIRYLASVEDQRCWDLLQFAKDWGLENMKMKSDIEKLWSQPALLDDMKRREDSARGQFSIRSRETRDHDDHDENAHGHLI
ncbi:hypothetical protein AAFC00_007147 [Neodothiora populina]|uniref:Pentatricopeptide repeat-containing protein-mitochondrial domain-containing protein n=1 Tax=Neodothiora populina TaxID=2781224 RepID=A0ABR3PHC0_9PEZI